MVAGAMVTMGGLMSSQNDVARLHPMVTSIITTLYVHSMIDPREFFPL